MANPPGSRQGPHAPTSPHELSTPRPAPRREYAVYYEFQKEEFGQYIKELRERSGLSLRRAAEHLGVSFGYIQRLETGGRARKPDFELIERLAALYGVRRSEVEAKAGVRKEALEDPHRLLHDQFKVLVMHANWRPPGMTEDWLDSFSVRQKRQIIQMMRQLGEQLKLGSMTPNQVLLEEGLLPTGGQE
ncbi:MAG: helix-turn-helix domain-containing protein [Alphaproteobacteria bacterium]|nr:helix-turn-helix domain-containing protein [Alphaproteobacteria bacterium]